jgi:flagellar biosynthesis component FlhA
MPHLRRCLLLDVNALRNTANLLPLGSRELCATTTIHHSLDIFVGAVWQSTVIRRLPLLHSLFSELLQTLVRLRPSQNIVPELFQKSACHQTTQKKLCKCVRLRLHRSLVMMEKCLLLFERERERERSVECVKSSSNRSSNQKLKPKHETFFKTY